MQKNILPNILRAKRLHRHALYRASTTEKNSVVEKCIFCTLQLCSSLGLKRECAL
jgi:hypothetical protein